MTEAEVPAPDGVPRHDDLAGTPSALDDALTRDALDTVELTAVLGLVAAHAAGELAAARLRARAPVADLDWIRTELARVGEIAALFRRGDALKAEPVPDVARALSRLRIAGSVLDGVELARIRFVIAAGRLVREDLLRVREAAPLAQALLADLPPRAAEKRLEQSLDDDGNVLDGASPALAAARREVHAARQRLVRRLESVLRSIDSSTESTVTVRGGRYVIPIRRDLRHRPGGIIHDESSSQGTLFIEPSEAVEFGNALREAEIAEERETLRVLRELTELLRPELATLRAAFEMCVAVDELVARARYAVAMRGDVPDLAPAPAPLRIADGRHPLLLGAGAEVVPFDLVLDGAERTLLVSGPNTGGKTVLLKAVALFAAMAQSGVVPPVGPGTRLPVFTRFAADIGDRQSIAASLSTFSAHVRTLGAILCEADDATLVLLDEVGSGTDPAEGAALAAATLVSLTRRGAVTLATTHLGSLKTLAAREPGVVNASLQFDAATLTPTYRFEKGVPGRSYGLAIARRLGLPADVVGDAETRVPEAERGLDALLAAVEERQQAVARQQERVDLLTAESEALAAKLAAQHEAQEARDAALRRREKEAERRAREQARAYLLESRAKVEEALGAARAAADDAAAREARRTLEEAIRAEGAALAADAAAEPGPVADDGARLESGQRVRTPTGAVGDVLELRGDGRAVVRIGAMKLVVEAKTLTRIGGGGKPDRSEPVRVDAAPPDANLEVDLRGMTGDEAESATIAAVDAAVLAEQPYLRIIHGMGTGVVRERVRRVVSSDRRVRSFAFAPRNLGGTGVTIVEFD
ncbi:MAG TPA: Smr/MutS family protein [Gemmatimonadales bacterium]|nr:Smr/MutS family protein [Gemmatimonadales bacterium]